jgi:hypothetical protein
MDTTTTTTMLHTQRGFYFNPDQDRYDNNNVQSLNQETSHFREERSTKPWKKQTHFAERIFTSTNTDPMSKSSQETNLTLAYNTEPDRKHKTLAIYLGTSASVKKKAFSGAKSNRGGRILHGPAVLLDLLLIIIAR